MGNILASTTQAAGGASVMAYALLTPFLRKRRITWGASKDEVTRSLPGDDLLVEPTWGFTQAITVSAPAENVWPWLVQIGQGRGGFYSYEALENVVGCQMRNADTIIPEFQTLNRGDNVLLHPKVPMPVARVEPGRAIVLNYDSRTGFAASATNKPRNYFQSVWLFCVEPKEGGKSRLIARFRIGYQGSLRDKMAYGYMMEAVSTTMQKRMLKGIKSRVEAIAEAS